MVAFSAGHRPADGRISLRCARRPDAEPRCAHRWCRDLRARRAFLEQSD